MFTDTSNPDKLLTLKEAGEVFQVSIYTIKRWLKSGKLKGIKLPGNQWRVPYSSCEELVKEGTK